MKKAISVFCGILLILGVAGCSVNTNAYPEESKSDIEINFEDGGDINGYKQPDTSSDTAQSAVSAAQSQGSNTQKIGTAYCANTKTKKFHKSACASAKQTNEENRYLTDDRNALIADGYEPCKRCNP